jgi:hypothetical protein
MLSFGIEASRAFSIAFWSAMFPPGSGPPSRAATMIARVSFEKSWPRFASVAPFFRLIDDARVVRKLGMEGSDQEAALPEEHGLPVELREDIHAGAGGDHARCADEDAAQGSVLAGQVEVGLEAEDLPAVRIARDLDVDEPEVVAVEHDQAGARAENRLLEASDRFLEAVEAHQAHERRRLAPRDDEPVEPRELLRLAHLDRLRTEPSQHRRVLAEVPLQGQNTDLHTTNSRFRPAAAGIVARGTTQAR